MKLRAISIAAGAVAAVAFAIPQSASASLVYDAAIQASAQGFGNAPRDLTLQATGQDTFESGGLAVSPTGTIVFGNTISDPNPLADDQKYGIPTIGSLGITNANQIAVLFNATEPGGDSVNVLDVTLKFYSSTGTLLGAIDGSQNFANSNPGNGVAGFTFVVDQAQQAYVNGLLANGPTTTLALEASIGNFAGGPESFLIYNLGTAVTPVPEPETYALMLAGLGAVGFMARRRRRA